MKLKFNLKKVGDTLEEIKLLDHGEELLIFDFSLGDKVMMYEARIDNACPDQFLTETGAHDIILFEDDWWCLDTEFEADPHPDKYLR